MPPESKNQNRLRDQRQRRPHSTSPAVNITLVPSRRTAHSVERDTDSNYHLPPQPPNASACRRTERSRMGRGPMPYMRASPYLHTSYTEEGESMPGHMVPCCDSNTDRKDVLVHAASEPEPGQATSRLASCQCAPHLAL